MASLTIGTRGSPLALCQARWVAAQLAARGTSASIRVIKTTGDQDAKVPLAALGAQRGVKGVFTKEIEDALIAGEIDLAVHSLKDLPTEIDERLALGCVPARADPRDALLGRRLAELRPGDRVGTGSLRRAEQLRALVPGVEIAGVRGNVDTRIRKLRSGQYDAIILAAAGLERLGLLDEAAELLAPAQMVPAIGQGALGIEIRAGNLRVAEALAAIHDLPTASEVAAERSLLRALGGGCDVPLGGHATCGASGVTLRAAAALDRGGLARLQETAPAGAAVSLGIAVAEKLRGLGVESSGPAA